MAMCDCVCVCVYEVCVSAHTTSAITRKLCTNHQAVLARGVGLGDRGESCTAAAARSARAARPSCRALERSALATDFGGETLRGQTSVQKNHTLVPHLPHLTLHIVRPRQRTWAVDECPGACCVVAKAHAGTCMHDVVKAVQGIEGGREEERKVFRSHKAPLHTNRVDCHTPTPTHVAHTHTRRA
jgi:hypothetical protein